MDLGDNKTRVSGCDAARGDIGASDACIQRFGDEAVELTADALAYRGQPRPRPTRDAELDFS